jgi:hypothetical protein
LLPKAAMGCKWRGFSRCTPKLRCTQLAIHLEFTMCERHWKPQGAKAPWAPLVGVAPTSNLWLLPKAAIGMALHLPLFALPRPTPRDAPARSLPVAFGILCNHTPLRPP